MPDGLNYVAILRGPIVLAAKTDTANIPFLFADDSRMGHVATGLKYPLQQMPMFAEAEEARLATITVDMVRPGEQQPEVDHLIESENSSTGVFRDRHFRDAKGWFSYRLTDKDKQSGSVRLTLWGGDKDRRFKILVNDEAITGVVLDSSRGNEFYSVDYIIPGNILQKANGYLRVKFLPAENSVAGGVYELRLLKKLAKE